MVQAGDDQVVLGSVGGLGKLQGLLCQEPGGGWLLQLK